MTKQKNIADLSSSDSPHLSPSAENAEKKGKKRRRGWVTLLWRVIIGFLLLLTLFILAMILVILYTVYRPIRTKTNVSIAPTQPALIDRIEKLPELQNDEMASKRWSGWRGYQSQGVAVNNSPPIAFGPGEDSIKWLITVLGKGYSSPVVWDERIFLTTEVNKKLFLLAYNRADGQLVWQKEVGKATGIAHSDNGHASSTPVTDGQYIYSYFGATGLFCHDFQGEEIWKFDTGNLKQVHGLATSPMLYKEMVILLGDNVTQSYIIALDKKTGEKRWKTDRPQCQGGWSTPVIANANGRDELLVNGDCVFYPGGGTFRSYDPATGKELWHSPGPVRWGIPTPLIGDEIVYYFGGQLGDIFAVKMGGSGDARSNIVWERSKSSPYVPSGLFYRNRIYVPTERKGIVVLDPGTGEQTGVIAFRDTCYASLVAADGRIYVITKSGEGYCFEAANEKLEQAQEWSLLHSTDFEETCHASPAIVDNQLIIRTATQLYCFESKGADR